MSAPFFSICIAAYKADRYIEACLASIESQSCRDFEVIIVDDGSPEPLTIDSALASRLPSIRIIRTENGGPYAARQRAYDEACGQVLLSVDADDALFGTDALSKILKAFSSGADIVVFNATNSECSAHRLFDYSALKSSDMDSMDCLWSLFTTSFSLNSLWCKAFRRSLYTTSLKKKRPRLLMAEDRLQSLEVMMGARSFVVVDEPLYFYRPNMTSTTNAGYEPSYFSQQCYVETEVLDFMRRRHMPLDGWATYFLELISGVLLGIRYNPFLSQVDRFDVYQSICKEHIVEIAMRFLESAALSKVNAVRLRLLRSHRFIFLDMSMLPWKCGSFIKGLFKR